MSDLISRQAAIDAIQDLPYGYRGMVRDIIYNLPSAKQNKTCEFWDSESSFCALNRPSAQRKGKLVRENIVLTSNPPQYRWHCSECEKSILGFTAAILTDYCPNCGAEIIKGESDE